ncbi:hypothetical protein F2Q70_00019484 [Brassica cretica]|uniref:Uncharacterized protein n=1 Tax=Brassica cretica TaxID=69181 RepID=A0A8S9GPK6_BRACR|nr:hypothetical protein F2Q70_00019484 [Brassica cretica]
MSLRFSVSAFQSEQIWVRYDLAFAGMDGKASLPPPPLNGTGLYPVLLVIDWLQLAVLDVDYLGFEDNPSDDISCSQDEAFSCRLQQILFCLLDVSAASFVSPSRMGSCIDPSSSSCGAPERELAASIDACLSHFGECLTEPASSYSLDGLVNLNCHEALGMKV